MTVLLIFHVDYRIIELVPAGDYKSREPPRRHFLLLTVRSAPFPPSRGPKALAAVWRPAGQVGFPGETTVEAEEAAAVTRKLYPFSLNWLIVAWKIHLNIHMIRIWFTELWSTQCHLIKKRILNVK
ncbi:Olfactory Receptor 52D1 [Manis pentadactyla]|nr:Olfactory Receptor 52D1 [Manis pentadactyla]